MDAQAILSAQGWRGKGHSLHPTDNSVGLSKPLLLSRKDGKGGLGQKPHYTSDQWWLNAFDQKLKGLDTSKKGAVVQTVTQGKLDAASLSSGKHSGLYAAFVSGGTLGGTISDGESTEDSKPVEEQNAQAPAMTAGKGSDADRRARKEARRARKLAEATNKSDAVTPPLPSGSEGRSNAGAKRKSRGEEEATRKERKMRKAAKKSAKSAG